MDDLELQAQQELDAMISGTNDIGKDTTDTEEIKTDVETETETDVEEGEHTEEEIETDEEKPKTKKEKTEDRFKKVLGDKNSYKTKAEEALAKVNELQNMLADKDFYSEKPQATKFKDEISSIMENNPNLGRDDAFNMIAGRENLSAKPKGLIGKPKAPEGKKDIKDMNSKELESAFEESGGLGAL